MYMGHSLTPGALYLEVTQVLCTSPQSEWKRNLKSGPMVTFMDGEDHWENKSIWHH